MAECVSLLVSPLTVLCQLTALLENFNCTKCPMLDPSLTNIHYLLYKFLNFTKQFINCYISIVVTGIAAYKPGSHTLRKHRGIASKMYVYAPAIFYLEIFQLTYLMYLLIIYVYNNNNNNNILLYSTVLKVCSVLRFCTVLKVCSVLRVY